MLAIRIAILGAVADNKALERREGREVVVTALRARQVPDV
jgi:hypothetical protein